MVVVVPFLQQMHGDYGPEGYADFWRFTPLAMERMFRADGFEILLLDYNREPSTSVYLFVIAGKNPSTWADDFPCSYEFKDPGTTRDGFPKLIGWNALGRD